MCRHGIFAIGLEIPGNIESTSDRMRSMSTSYGPPKVTCSKYFLSKVLIAVSMSPGPIQTYPVDATDSTLLPRFKMLHRFGVGHYERMVSFGTGFFSTIWILEPRFYRDIKCINPAVSIHLWYPAIARFLSLLQRRVGARLRSCRCVQNDSWQLAATRRSDLL